MSTTTSQTLQLARQHHRSGQLAEAEALYPDHTISHFGYSLLLLTLGKFEEGWDEFEWRRRVPELKQHRPHPEPQWDGSNFADKTLLLHTEGGFGDAVHFIRYVPMVASRGGKIILECQPELIRLFTQISHLSAIIPWGQ
jgi:hypothetical protein